MKALQKSSLREIRKSLGRYLAILAIVALGVGFFCGLRVCRDAMVETGDDYLDRQSMYDYRLISTVGFDGFIRSDTNRASVAQTLHCEKLDNLAQASFSGNSPLQNVA